MSKPTFSIIIPSYNYARYILEAIDSVLNQTYSDFELIIIDDGSKDETRQVLKTITDPRVRIYYQKNHGVSYTMNRGITLSRGKYIGFLDCDDIYHRDKLHEQVQKFSEGYDIVTTKVTTIDAQGNLVKRSLTNDWYNKYNEKVIFGRNQKLHFLKGNYLCKSAVALKRKLFDEFGFFDTRLITAYDFDLWYKMIDKAKITRVNKSLVYYRYHGQNDSLVNNIRIKAEVTLLYDRIIDSLNKSPAIEIGKFPDYLRAVDFFFMNNNLYKPYLYLQLHKKRYKDPFDSLTDTSWLDSIRFDSIEKDSIEKTEVFPAPPNKTGLRARIGTARDYYRTKGPFFLIKRTLYKISPPQLRRMWKQVKERFTDFLYWRRIGQYRKSKTSILMIVPWMTVGGGDQVNLDVVKAMKSHGTSTHMMTTMEIDHVWKHKFEKYVTEISHLEKIPSHTDRYAFILKYIERAGIKTIFVSNSGLGYDVLPLIREKFPKIRIVDLVHGQGGKRESGGFPAYSAPFDKYIDTRITVTNYMKDYLTKKFNINPEKITVIHNAVDTKDFKHGSHKAGKYRSKHKIPSSSTLVSFVGRLSYEKHPEIFIKIAEILITGMKCKNLYFVLAGDGDLRVTLERKVKEMNLSKNVLFTGNIDDPCNLYADSDLFVLCSEIEGLPYVILEAMAMGLPVIASKVGGIPEIIDHQHDGILVPYNKSTAENMAHSALHLIENKKILSEIGKKARMKIVRDFAIKEFRKKYVQVLTRNSP